MRAAIMSFVYVFCSGSGRRYNRLAILILLAVVFMLFNPLIIYDIGFLLSFIGIVGIILFNPIFEEVFKKIPDFLFKEIFSASLSAQIATFPLTIYFFQQFATFSALNNALMLPWLAPTILCSYMIQLPFVGIFAAYLCGAVVKIMYFILEGLAHLPGYFEPKISQSKMFIIYAVEISVYAAVVLFIRYRDKKAIEKA